MYSNLAGDGVLTSESTCRGVPLNLSYFAGRNVSLQPSDVRVDVGSWASFNCTLSCDFSQTHTINWFIGESPISRRNVYLSINNVAEREFEEYTGIQIELQDTSNCRTATSGQEMAQQQLRVFVSTARAVNRTAVQCAALRKDDADVDMYSFYGVILVNGTLTAQVIFTDYACIKINLV